MIYLFMALACEASPIIKQFRLKQVLKLTKFRLYKNDEIILTVTGVGKLRAAMAVVYSFSNSLMRDDQMPTAINFGLCGAMNPEYPIGEMVAVNKIIDRARRRASYPDMIFKHGLRESAVETVDQPAQDTAGISGPLVDMEAAGFWEGAALYLSPDRVLCVKIISDIIGEKFISAREASNLVESRLPEFCALSANWQKYHRPPVNPLSASDQALLEHLITQYHLTESQQQQLRQAARSHVLRHHSALPDLRSKISGSVDNKNSRRLAFNALLAHLDPESRNED